jgi:hypothetical protein
MNIQKEFDVRNSPSDRPSVVGSKHNSAMRCANPQCSKELLYLREGTLELLELESHSGNQFRPDEGGFAMRSLPSKFFWLCGECAKTLMVKRWTTSGLVLVPRNQSAAGGHPNLAVRPATTATTRPLPVSLTVLPIPPMKHPLHPSASLSSRSERTEVSRLQSGLSGKLLAAPDNNLRHSMVVAD